MKKFIAVMSIVFFVFASAGLALADEPVESGVLEALDRNAVWTKWFDEGRQEKSQSASTDSEDKKAEAIKTGEGRTMNVRIDDRPWARVG